MKDPDAHSAILYILRPSRLPLALWKEKISIRKYRKSFQESDPILLHEFSLADGEYICLELEEGYYQLKAKDVEKILYLEKNRVQFMDYFLFNESFFATAERYFKDLNSKEAILFLINSHRLDRHSHSMD
ncbi:hypothetical protein DLM77_20110 [Leptospira yasudae]|uniref:DUF1564 domain-containing protein n=1 Tax=Leptospira yasudae TaxID=2202201 RepID=A0ABX9LYU5_9LEPT|nr:hypothetical protein DLM77_20110 [Leptospira yasudae]